MNRPLKRTRIWTMTIAVFILGGSPGSPPIGPGLCAVSHDSNLTRVYSI